MNVAHFCEFWCFSSGKQARFTSNFCSGMPLWKVHELAFLWFGLPGPLLIDGRCSEVWLVTAFEEDLQSPFHSGGILACLAVTPLLGESLKGQHDRGNRTESLREGNLPLRGSLRGRVFRGFQRFSEVSEISQRFSEVLSETLSEADFLSEALSPVAPNRVAPWACSNSRF